MTRASASPANQPGPKSPLLGSRNPFWPILLAIMILVASGREAVAAPFLFPHADKIIHFFIFGLLATLVLRVDSLWRRPGWRGWLAIAAVSLFGVLDEFRQSFTPGRFVEFEDWAADTLGAVVAVSVYLLWGNYRALLEKPLWARAGKLASSKEISR